MNIFLYTIFFIMGAFFGSFYTLAVYRIPLKQNIVNMHSYCPKCNHKLGVLDLFPVLSYIFLGGKCRYCKNKIRIRYLLLEVLSGLVFVLFALSLKIDIYNLNLNNLIYFVFGILYMVSLFIIAGIDKEKINIQKSVLMYGLFVLFSYIVYLYILNINIYRYVIYLFIMLMLILVETIQLKNKAYSDYTLQILTLGTYIAIFSGEINLLLTIILTIVSIGIKEILIELYKNTKQKKEEKQNTKKLPVGFYLCVSNIIVLITMNLLK